MEKRARLRELLVELESKAFHPLAEEDPHIDFVEQRALKMTLAQHLVTERMEGGNVGKGLDFGQGLAHAALHFPRRLLGKGQRQDVFRLNPRAGVFLTAARRSREVGKQRRFFGGASRRPSTGGRSVA